MFVEVLTVDDIHQAAVPQKMSDAARSENNMAATAEDLPTVHFSLVPPNGSDHDDAWTHDDDEISSQVRTNYSNYFARLFAQRSALIMNYSVLYERARRLWLANAIRDGQTFEI